MSQLLDLEALNLESVSASVDASRTLRVRGEIAVRNPAETLLPYFRSVHDAAAADNIDELRIDLRKLTFMNSSSIRLLISWLDWVLAEPPERRYVMHFLTDKNATWQATTFSVLCSLSADQVKITAK